MSQTRSDRPSRRTVFAVVWGLLAVPLLAALWWDWQKPRPGTRQYQRKVSLDDWQLPNEVVFCGREYFAIGNVRDGIDIRTLPDGRLLRRFRLAADHRFGRVNPRFVTPHRIRFDRVRWGPGTTIPIEVDWSGPRVQMLAGDNVADPDLTDVTYAPQYRCLAGLVPAPDEDGLPTAIRVLDVVAGEITRTIPLAPPKAGEHTRVMLAFIGSGRTLAAKWPRTAQPIDARSGKRTSESDTVWTYQMWDTADWSRRPDLVARFGGYGQLDWLAADGSLGLDFADGVVTLFGTDGSRREFVLDVPHEGTPYLTADGQTLVLVSDASPPEAYAVDMATQSVRWRAALPYVDPHRWWCVLDESETALLAVGAERGDIYRFDLADGSRNAVVRNLSPHLRGWTGWRPHVLLATLVVWLVGWVWLHRGRPTLSASLYAATVLLLGLRWSYAMVHAKTPLWWDWFGRNADALGGPLLMPWAGAVQLTLLVAAYAVWKLRRLRRLAPVLVAALALLLQAGWDLDRFWPFLYWRPIDLWTLFLYGRPM